MAKTKKKEKDRDELYEKCDTLVNDYSLRDTMLDEIEDYYFLEGAKDEDSDSEEEIEQVRLPHATNIVDLVVDLLSGTEVSIIIPARSETTTDKELADVGEDYLWAVWRQNERRQRLNLLQRMSWLIAVRGCVAGRVVPTQALMRYKAEEELWETKGPVPIQILLRDPRYVYPRFTTDGVLYIVERFDRTLEDIRAAYGDDVLPERTNLQEAIEWTEYWSPTTYCYWADGEPIKRKKKGLGPWPHEYGGLPYSFEFARQTGKVEPEYRVRPMLQSLLRVIDKMDWLDTMQHTFLSKYIGDVLMVTSDEMAREGAQRQITTETGQVNYLKLDEKVAWLNAGRQPIELEIARSKLEAMFEKGTFPSSIFGTDPGRAMAGYALQMLNQAGRLKLRTIVDCAQRFIESICSNVLMVSEKHLVPLLGGKVPFYATRDVLGDEVSRRTRKRLQFDAERLDGYWEVEAQLGDLMPADEQGNVVLATRVRAAGPDGRPLLSWESAVDRYHLAHSPKEERDRIDREAAFNDPVVTALRQKLFATQIIRELKDELTELDVDPEEVIAQMNAQGNAQNAQPQPPAMLPSSELPPAMQGAPPSVPGFGMPPEQMFGMPTNPEVLGPGPMMPPGMAIPPQQSGMMPGVQGIPAF